jgi:hypothetical protein
MAGANLPAKKYKKTAPTILRLSFEGIGGATQYVDIAKALSAVNRKFYRQGVYYYVNSVELYNNEDAFVDLHTLPDNWITKNAHQRGFQLFQRMNAQVSEAGFTARPKYHDFKVYMDSTHQGRGSLSPSLHGINSVSAVVESDDWEYSKFVSADDDGDATQEADDFFVHMLGGHTGSAGNWTSVGLIKSYGETRATVNPDTPDDANFDATDPLVNVFDMSSEEQLNDLIDNLNADNDDPPYDYNRYVGEVSSNMQHVARLATSVSTGRVAKASGFCAPFGLVCVDPQDTATAWRLVINLAAGTYHGTYAERA